MDILGVRIDNLAKNEALAKTQEFLHSPNQHLIFTPNPEMLVQAHQDQYFKEVLNKGSLNLCDGKGIQFVSKRNLPAGRQEVERIPGVDFMLEVCALAEKEKKSIYLLGSGNKDVVEKCKEKLLEKFPQLKIVGINPGLKLTNLPTGQLEYNSDENDEIINHIILTSPDILFVAFGHNKQEKWLYENLPHLPSVKIAMGVGGAFDYISEKIKRAPHWMQTLGLEWLYRVTTQPQRIKRIWNATIVFLWYVYKEKK